MEERLAAAVVVEMGEGEGAEEAAVLRKTRAGGNWLIGGMVVVVGCMSEWVGGVTESESLRVSVR